MWLTTLYLGRIPLSAWNQTDQSGDFSTMLPLAQNKMVVFSMGDATGVTTGGVSNIMTVGAPASGTPSCNTTDPGPAFFFATDSALQECKNYPFSLFVSSGAVLPISVLITIPNSESFVLHPPNNNDPFNWNANLTAGTQVLFSMTDAQGRPGGTSSLTTVQQSDDTSCVHPLPSSAALTRTPSPTGSAPASNTGGSGGNDNNNNNDGSNNHLGLIIGVSVAGAVVLIGIIALIWFFSKRNGGGFATKRVDLTEPGPDSSTQLLAPGHPQQAHYPPPMTFPPYRDAVTPFTAGPTGVPPTTMYNNNLPVNSTIPLDGTMGTAMAAGIYTAVGPSSNAHPSQRPMSAKQREALEAQRRQQEYHQQQQRQSQHYQQDYFDPYEAGNTSPVASHSGYFPTSASRQTAHSDVQSQFGVASSSNYSSTLGPSTHSSAMSSNKGKERTSMTNPSPQPRVIVHTDIEDEPIELPPMYSEARNPLPGMASTTAPQSGKGGIQ
ncbi:hypothetical protein NP233_g3021 [Leucocoprinus birnbaumii]|uniref:Uncharacterized protein n=1 Tax=Leucocoprinus birnbaumii TaxID=56174 RepID=A0AAD5W0B7_9AGAR|nr:hypothetical protein NP233_g3021 [Leucocoprinus birnbaumii]